MEFYAYVERESIGDSNHTDNELVKLEAKNLGTASEEVVRRFERHFELVVSISVLTVGSEIVLDLSGARAAMRAKKEARWNAEREQRDRAEYERLKAKFEGGG